MAIDIRFVGSFRGVSGKNALKIEFGESVSIKVLIKKVIAKLPKLKNALIDPSSGQPRQNMLVLVNGREISVLDGFETIVNDEDTVVFVPVIHGG